MKWSLVLCVRMTFGQFPCFCGLLTVSYLYPSEICHPRTPPWPSSLFRIVSLAILPHDSALSIWRLVLWSLDGFSSVERAEPARPGRRPMPGCQQVVQSWLRAVEEEMGMRNRFKEYVSDRLDKLVAVTPGEWGWYACGTWVLRV